MELVIICLFTKVLSSFIYFFSFSNEILEIIKIIILKFYKAPPSISVGGGGSDGETLERGMVSSDG